MDLPKTDRQLSVQDIASIEGPIRVRGEGFGEMNFSNGVDLLRWQSDNPNTKIWTIKSDNTRYVGELPELEVTAKGVPTQDILTEGIDQNVQLEEKPTTQGSPNHTPFNDTFYNMSDWDSLLGQDRVNINKRAWENNPEYMQNWTDSGNAAAAFTVAPFATAALGEYAIPWLANTGLSAASNGARWVWNGAKWVIQNLKPSSLTNGLSYYLPQYTSALNTAGLWGDAAMYSYLAKDATDRLLSEDGINKTINLYSNGDIYGGTKSLAGDVLDASMTIPFTQGFYNYGRGLIDPMARKTAFIRQIYPVGYGGHGKDIRRFLKDWLLYPIEQYPAVPQYSMEGIDPLMKMNIRTRQEAIRLSLGFPPSPNSSYTLNPDGTYSYNYSNIFKKLVPENERDFVRSAASLNISDLFRRANWSGIIHKPGASGVIRDPITGAGGNVRVTVTQDGGFVIDDVWDLEPFKHKRWLPKPIRDFEAIKFLGGEPLVLKHEIPQGFYLNGEVLSDHTYDDPLLHRTFNK